MAAAEQGEVQCVLAYSNSRHTRRPAELERLITAHDWTGVQVRSIVSGDDDLSTADGRMTGRIKGSVDTAEAEKVSERVSAAVRQRAERGRIHDRTAFGYEAVKGADPPRFQPGGTTRRTRGGCARRHAGCSEGSRSTASARTGTPRTASPGSGVGWSSPSLKRALTAPAIAVTANWVTAPWSRRPCGTPFEGDDDWRRLRELLRTGGARPAPVLDRADRRGIHPVRAGHVQPERPLDHGDAGQHGRQPRVRLSEGEPPAGGIDRNAGKRRP